MDSSDVARVGRVKVKRISGVLALVVAWLCGALGFALPASAQTFPAPYLTAYRYQDGGLLAGTISPAAGGQSNFLASRNTYDTKGRLQKVETGVLASWPADPPLPADPIAPANWTGFTISKTVTYTYDANGRKVMEALAGSDGMVAQRWPRNFGQRCKWISAGAI